MFYVAYTQTETLRLNSRKDFLLFIRLPSACPGHSIAGQKRALLHRTENL